MGKCETCLGTGEVDCPNHDEPDTYEQDNKWCRVCNESGNVKCEDCGGSGRR